MAPETATKTAKASVETTHNVAQLAVGLIKLSLEVLCLLAQARNVIGKGLLLRAVLRVDLSPGLLDEPGVSWFLLNL